MLFGVHVFMDLFKRYLGDPTQEPFSLLNYEIVSITTVSFATPLSRNERTSFSLPFLSLGTRGVKRGIEM
jgi:hypothetical protein